MPVMPVSGVDYIGVGPGQLHGPVPGGLKWDPKNLEIRTTSVERTLEPLVIQVVTKTGMLEKCVLLEWICSQIEVLS